MQLTASGSAVFLQSFFFFFFFPCSWAHVTDDAAVFGMMLTMS